ncbi:MAG: hypothetical protein OHK0013_05690 [Sandaracinaceae bacterium]
MVQGENDDRLLKTVAAVLVVVLVAALAHAAVRASEVARLERGSVEIVEIEARRGAASRANTQRVPVGVLELPSGERVRVALESSSNSPFCCEVGERVEIVYGGADLAGTARVDRITELYGPQLHFASVAALFLVPLVFALRRAPTA